ncbi:hypothetical protein E2C01_039128 [Portunus trituberculatus]|uniref:Uncharacterized protein n=1 Tax=Portunus trituberculatus TaxID=210409 RepID=A0A5B7FCU0_PORTR|nr:hypothetical protein [Portunus trituberculatus]
MIPLVIGTTDIETNYRTWEPVWRGARPKPPRDRRGETTHAHRPNLPVPWWSSGKRRTGRKKRKTT